MGNHEAWPDPPPGLLPNGLLPGEAASVIQALDSERWSKAEERTAELITCIQPNQPSEERRNAVANYVQRLIMKCFPCQQVFTFGSVPLKTYLPDGDIDLTAFSKNQNLKETWAHQVRDILESEERNENAEFQVKEVQYIQAEVKIIKCLVENIVVDISFNQLGGLCTLCFLEEVDNLINRNHLFKRSIILIKAWCYYESRILGAHHGLISTYALETLVLYIFHVFNDFAGPLEVLYRFLEFFSKFDWDNYCVSLWGPVPISSLPDVTAEPPRKDGGDLLLSKVFLDACSTVYAVFPSGQENQGLPFVSKHFNVIDPLRVNNNLGRSVSRGNFFRIRSAFTFGAKKLARLIDCPKEDLLFEINEFFMNTWDRHGCGHRPDAPRNDLWLLRPLNEEHVHRSEGIRPNSSRSGTSSGHEVPDAQSAIIVSQQLHNPLESTNRSSNVLALSQEQTQKSYSNVNNTRLSDQTRQEICSKQAKVDKDQSSSRPDHDTQGRYLFARTHSSPELTHSYGELPSLGRQIRGHESEKNHASRMENSRKKNVESDLNKQEVVVSTDDTGSARQVPSQRAINKASDSVSSSNSYHDDDSRSGILSEDFFSASGTRGRHDDHDLVNVISSSQVPAFNGQVHMPLNLSAGHLPLNIVSMGFPQRNAAGVAQNVPVMEVPWGGNVPLPPGLMSPSVSHYFPSIKLASAPEDSMQHGEQSFGSTDSTYGEVDTDYWHDQDRGSAGGFDIENGEFENFKSDGLQSATSTSYGSIPLGVGTSGSYARLIRKPGKESRVSNRDDQDDVLQYQGREDEVYMDERPTNSRSMRPARSSSFRSKTSSESSWDGAAAKTSKSSREKRGRKVSNSPGPFTSHGKGKSLSDQSSARADDEIRDLSAVSFVETESIDRGSETQSLASGPIQTHQLHGFEPSQAIASESMMPFAPVLLGPDSRQRPVDNSRLLFYPTGPPVPFVAMWPFPYFSGESGGSETSSSHFGGEEGIENRDNPQNFVSSVGLDNAEELSTLNSVGSAVSVEPSEHKSDILNSDFASHWHNLQYGRFCQTSHDSSPLIYPSPGVLSPIYLQGRVPWDGTGRPLSSNMNVLTYGPRLVPVTPMQPVSNGPSSIYYVDEMPRYRSGTGTYLPNTKVSTRDRQTSGNRRGNYNYDRGEQHADREGNWNTGPKSRARGHNRSQAEKTTSRIDRIKGGESQNDRTWGSYRHGSFASYQSQNNPIRASTSQGVPINMSYGMYPLTAMNSNMVPSNGPIPSMVMLYPYDQHTRYSSSSEQLEFGSFGALNFPGVNEVPQLIEGHQSPNTVEERRLRVVPATMSSPDQPSSPHVMR
ncbi:hypothetical protein MLD38_023436 [Melastoma candidum]|uniref:Uncharacterized protein n=1 Tax=Melastoma candidum TaxID=119954 RepID=A0ACB9NP76_9MYRT|nr:hypothetical protein MLD38_023436 [Melastoma candidum]